MLDGFGFGSVMPRGIMSSNSSGASGAATQDREIGLSRDPAPPSEQKVAPSALWPVPLTVTARLAWTRVPASRIARLSLGSVLKFDTALDEPASLLIGDVEIARGECGVARGMMAFSVLPPPTEESVLST